MLVLAFDTSTPAVTVAVGAIEPREFPEGGWFKFADDGVTVLAMRTEVAANRHGELLAPLISDVLADAGVQPGDLGAIAVGLGPGPFTGLRVGIMTAKAMADALRLPTYGECSLRLISPGVGGVATNARRKQVYWAIAGSETNSGPDIASPEEAAARFAAAHVPTVAGEGPLLYPQAFADLPVLADAVYPRAELLVLRVAERVRTNAPSDDLTPLYLRRPDAQPPGKPKLVTPA
ncbi:MAG TPA: tRNA (adenosine(37)-N6)-threonylcarbamoyltransferase complex dimerization subunit type 1 TsaB [Micromonosporaceae bacterium]